MGYAAEIFGIFYSQCDYQMVNISRILKFLTWHEFDEFGWNDPTDSFYSQVILIRKPTEWEKKNDAGWITEKDQKVTYRQYAIKLFSIDNKRIQNRRTLKIELSIQRRV